MTVKTPAGLAPTGKSLWKRLTDAYEFDVWELAIVEASCRQADDVARLEQAITENGIISMGSQGQPRLSQTVGEARQGRLALARLLDTLRIPAEEDPAAVNGRSARSKRAADARWSRVARAKEARDGAA